MISAKKYQEKMDAIIAMGKPISDTFIAMVEEAGKYNLSQKVDKIRDKKRDKNGSCIEDKEVDKIADKKWINFSTIRQELYCEHGVGHGFHVHGCCGCCADPSFTKEFKLWQKKMDRVGIRSQKRILKEFTKQKRKVHKP
jgi:hypothetical protein